jgi:predicted alpha/beta hydrolase family esterase
MKGMDTTVLILPGINNSGPDHWQSLWEQANPAFVRVEQRDWDHPACGEWVKVLDRTLETIPGNPILVAHSLACLVVAHWAASARRPIKGALLVAPPNPQGPNFPKAALGFSRASMRKFAFPSVIVASSNDPYGGIEIAEAYASAWGCRLVNVGALGHINAASGLGEWRDGFALLQSLIEA